MSQLFYKNWNSRVLTSNKTILVATVKNFNTKSFGFSTSTSFPIFNLIRQALLNKQKIFNYAKLTLSNLIRNKLKIFKLQFNEIKHSKRLYALSFSTAGLFTWDDYRITNNEVKYEIEDVLTTFKLNEQNRQINFEDSRHLKDDWEKIYDKKELIIWRRKIVIEDDELDTDDEELNLNELYEYKVLGRINDVTPIEFYETQIDLNFRKKWDYLAISIEMIEKDVTSNTELVRWISKFPYPLYPREYIYVRRYCIEPNEKLLILISRGLPAFDLTGLLKPGNKAIQSVRVSKYKSNMIIIPHNDFDKPGLDYVMQYYDVNKAKIPKLAYKWMATSGLPDYIDKLHKATLQLKHINQKLQKTNITKSDLLSKFELFNLKEKVKVSDETMNTSNESTESNTNSSTNDNEIDNNENTNTQNVDQI